METNQSQNQKTIEELLQGSNETPEALSLDQLWAPIITTLENLDASMASLHLAIRSLNSRVASLENFVSFLLSKDPEAGPRIKAIMEATENAAPEKSTDEPVL